MMKVTKVRYHIYKEGESRKPSIKAICSYVLNDCLIVHKTVIEYNGNGSYGIKPPLQKSRRQHYYYSIDSEFTKYLTDVLIKGYFWARDNNEEWYTPTEGTAR